MRKIILFFMTIFLAVPIFSSNIPRYIGSKDVEVDIEDLVGFFDGVPVIDNTINGLDFEEGVHSLRLIGSYQEFLFKIIVDTVPPTNVSYTIRDPNLVIFDNEVRELNYCDRINYFGEKLSGTVKRDSKNPLVIFNEDEAGNIGGFVVIPPNMNEVTPLDSKALLSGITEKNILLSSKSPYKIVGKVVIPEKALLFFEPFVELKTLGSGDITVKGTVYIPENVKLSGNLGFQIEENGRFYLGTKDFNGRVSSNGGQLAFIENTKIEELNISKTNVFILKNAIVKNLKISHVGFVAIENSTITNLEIKNTRQSILNNLLVENLSIEGFTNSKIYSLKATKFSCTDFSNTIILFSNIENALFERGSYFHGKENNIENLKSRNYCVGKLFKSKINNMELFKAKLLLRLTEINEKIFDKKSIIEEY